ncbi:MAG: aminotransferase class I/II-fold pyridoxal phosphate-dependent enzyme, partial [Cyclobacteriaceae bacterium]|nr:aminotransferase class I/II-fold pyridoxal phosphate-dependent enzyme [Cyclobacteriaceae bacterium]
MLIDLRSDTLTKPSPGMLNAMMNARVGDDVFGEDPTVQELEEKGAEMLGFEAGLFCPSGTMTNQIAIRILTQPQDEVICDKRSHIYLYEGGGIAYNSMVSVELVDGDRGRITPDQIVNNIKPDNVHFPKTRLVALENTVNKGGGCYYTMDQIRSINKVCKNHGLLMHLDGARLFNALVETKNNPSDIGKYFDTVSVCLSKGLGAPVGSLLLSSKEYIKKARRVRKVFGGGMRQAGYLAAAGIYALDNNIQRLKKDHERAREIAKILSGCNLISNVEPVDTNIIIFSLEEGIEVNDFLNQLKGKGILVLGFGGNSIRMVTHLDINDDMMEQ